MRRGKGGVDDFDPVADGPITIGVQMLQAADITGYDDRRLGADERLPFSLAEGLGQPRVAQGVRARRATAESVFGDRDQGMAQGLQDLDDPTPAVESVA